jgi:hypothetical protein
MGIGASPIALLILQSGNFNQAIRAMLAEFDKFKRTIDKAASYVCILQTTNIGVLPYLHG